MNPLERYLRVESLTRFLSALFASPATESKHENWLFFAVASLGPVLAGRAMIFASLVYH